MFGSRLGMLILVALVIPCPAGWAQESASSGIVGQVTDSTRGALPGASVTVTNTGTNAQRTAVTDIEGRFTIPNLPPATYQIRVELSGFRSEEHTSELQSRSDLVCRLLLEKKKQYTTWPTTGIPAPKMWPCT